MELTEQQAARIQRSEALLMMHRQLMRKPRKDFSVISQAKRKLSSFLNLQASRLRSQPINRGK